MSEPVLMLPSMCLPSYTSNICRIRQVCSFQQGLGPMRRTVGKAGRGESEESRWSPTHDSAALSDLGLASARFPHEPWRSVIINTANVKYMYISVY